MIQGKVLDVESYRSNLVKDVQTHILIHDINDTTPLVVQLLEDGDVPVIAEYNGQRRIMKRMSTSAYNIDKILRTHKEIEYVDGEGLHTPIKTIRDYLEVISGWML